MRKLIKRSSVYNLSTAAMSNKAKIVIMDGYTVGLLLVFVRVDVNVACFLSINVDKTQLGGSLTDLSLVYYL